MAGRVKQSDIEELKARIDLVELIGSYVSLKPASAGSFKGLCPFHGEKSPSFNVRSNPAFYHCFGCGVGGDAIKFIQEIESLSFMEAVERLAEKVGFTLTYEDGSSEQSGRSRLLAANSAAAEFYVAQLHTEEGAFARDFLVKRGFAPETWERFGIGYSPKGWQGLTNPLKAKGFSDEELISSGLSMKGDRGLYDRFRGRLLWPIRDANSQVLGFGARKLYEDDQGPKYLNTPETPVYHKGSVLYGLDLARRDIVKQREVVVVEGYTDVMACHLAGVTTAVATCGTAFGEDHIKLINRMLGGNTSPSAVVFTFDPDAAGQKAALRIYSDTDKFNALTYVAAGPDGLDPSDLRQSRGDEAIKQMLSQRKPLFEFVIRHRISQFQLGDLDGRVAAARAAAPVVAEIVDPALKAGYVRALAEWVSLEVSEVQRLVATQSTTTTQQRVEPLRRSPQTSTPPSATNRAERGVLEVLVQHPSAFTSHQLQRIAAAGFTDSSLQRFLIAAAAQSEHLGEPDFANRLAATLSGDELDLLRALSLAELPVLQPSELAKYTTGVVNGALLQAMAREKSDLLAALKRLDPVLQAGPIEQIQRELISLEAERRALM